MITNDYMPDWVIGDIHGRKEVVAAAEKLEGSVLFVGDFMDSFVRPVDDQIHCLKKVIDKTKDGAWKFLVGNHELSYMCASKRCSGWKKETQNKINKYVSDIEEYGEFYLYNEKLETLFTHAGLTKSFFSKVCFEYGVKTVSEYLSHMDDNNSCFDSFYSVGVTRGGYQDFGGPLWADLSEFSEIRGLRQVFGHTDSRKITRVGNGYNVCIDVLGHVGNILKYNRETNEFDIYQLPINRHIKDTTYDYIQNYRNLINI